MAGNQQYDNEKRGVLFKQREKNNDRSPDYTGNVTIEGKEWRLAGWIKEGRNGAFLSLALSEPQNGSSNRESRRNDGDGFMGESSTQSQAPTPRQEQGRSTSKTNTSFDEMDDDIPF